MMVRFCAMALASTALTACASGYGGGYDYYPGETYYDDPYHPYYGGGFGYGSFHDHYDDDDYNRHFQPARNVSCDRARDVCYDRYGPSYEATARYLGESEANRAYKKYGDSVFLFSPRPGVGCDRRTNECSDGAAPDPMRRLEPGNPGSVGSGSGFDDDDEPVRRIAPVRRSIDDDDDDAVTRRIAPQEDAERPRLADDNDIVRPSRQVQRERRNAFPRLNSDDKARNGGAGNGCPPKGCTD